MPTNRDYTGLVRTPSSMAWLIKKRSLVKGQIDRLSKMQADIPDMLRALQEELDATGRYVASQPLSIVRSDLRSSLVDPSGRGRSPGLIRHQEWHAQLAPLCRLSATIIDKKFHAAL